ncbi:MULTISPECIES: helix-turn-helix domain-containing protein [unclassified Xanthobacter]|uniref:helix-turn-helix domain-containing protein n=1 Tax=unclassified Xanthobacter TaxID=2623496 RepID=UPI001EDD8629|nr:MULTISPECIES: helix-turn-helix domain-containing protein [unclassified Xanthobacter]
MTKTAPVRWDRHSIKAEVHRRGATLRAISVAAGLEPGACSAALRYRNIRGERALAKFLGVAPERIWPDRYAHPTPWAKTSLNKICGTSQNDTPSTDSGVAA